MKNKKADVQYQTTQDDKHLSVLPNGKILGIDFGQNHTGLAISDKSGEFIFARESIKNFGSLEKLFIKIEKIYTEENVKTVVIGLPLDKEGNLTPQSLRIKKIGQKLGDYIGLKKIFYEDESFSSFEAREVLKEQGIEGSERKKYEDSLAAVIFLKRYLKKLKIKR